MCWALARRGERWLAVATLAAVGGLDEAVAAVPLEAVLAGAISCLLLALAAEAVGRVTGAGPRRALFATLTLATLLLPVRVLLRAVPPLRPISVAVLSSVPLGPVASGADGAGGELMEVLRRVGPVTLLDTVPEAGPDADRLLLLQPRHLSPEELVAIDGWVRRGGWALVLADPRLDWARPFPLGDPRNPQATSLLDPLLEHWGARLELEDPTAGRADDLALPSPGELRPLSSACRAVRRQRAVRCRVGRGKALVVADADWLDPGRWPARAGRPDEVRRALRSLRLDRPRGGPPLALGIGLLLLIAAMGRTRVVVKKNMT